MAKILLLGCGDLGCKLALRLITAKHTVIAVKRTALKIPIAGLQVVLADITAAQSVQKIPTDVDVVVFILSPSERNKAAYQNLYGQGLLNVLSHFADFPSPTSGARPRCLLVSSTSVYGRGRESLLRRVREGNPIQYDPPCYSNRIHEEDCLGILCFLIDMSLSNKPLENLYLASDSAAVPLAEAVLWLSDKMVYPPPPARSADLALKGMNKRCCNGRLLRLGYVLRYSSYREGYGELLEQV